MHHRGSHGPDDHKRVPAGIKRFLPECRSNALQGCSPAELVHAGGNTIAYTDRVMAQAIGWLQRRHADNDTALVSVSDHGESLGEGNLHLHGLPSAIAPDLHTRVPWITWLSPGLARRQRLDAACLQGRADVAVVHDHCFHSVLGLLGVLTRVYQPALAAYAACRGR